MPKRLKALREQSRRSRAGKIAQSEHRIRFILPTRGASHIYIYIYIYEYTFLLLLVFFLGFLHHNKKICDSERTQMNGQR